MMKLRPAGFYNLVRIEFLDGTPMVQLMEHTNQDDVFKWWLSNFKEDFMFRGWEVWEARKSTDGDLVFHTRHFMCHHEGAYKTHPMSILGATGYAYLNAGPGDLRKVCYACAGEIDREHMDKHGYITLHLDGLIALRLHAVRHVKRQTQSGVKIHVSNWCGSLSYPVDLVRTGNGGLMKIRRDIWFTDHNGDQWYGLQLGNKSPLVYCRRLKRKTDGELRSQAQTRKEQESYGSNKGTNRRDSAKESREEDSRSEDRPGDKQKSQRLLVGSTTSV